jgi:hypothetical protein
MSATGMPSVMAMISGISADGVGGAGRRHVDHASVAAGFFPCLRHRVENRQAEMRRAAFARRGTADHLGAIGDRLLGMERAVLAGKALADDLGVLVDEDGHELPRLFFTSP